MSFLLNCSLMIMNIQFFVFVYFSVSFKFRSHLPSSPPLPKNRCDIIASSPLVVGCYISRSLFSPHEIVNTNKHN